MLRFFDILFSLIGLVILSPLFLIIAIWIRMESKGPVFYKQIRVGRNNTDFNLYKFRSMRENSEQSGLLTVGGRDPRITQTGYYLRKYKADELPQLLNVFIGDMSLVGPRPEVRKYVNLYTPEQLKVLSIRPGITDEASLKYKNENEILGQSLNPEKTYIEEIMPHKLILNQNFLNNPNLYDYFRIIFTTIFTL